MSSQTIRRLGWLALAVAGLVVIGTLLYTLVSNQPPAEVLPIVSATVVLLFWLSKARQAGGKLARYYLGIGLLYVGLVALFVAGSVDDFNSKVALISLALVALAVGIYLALRYTAVAKQLNARREEQRR